MIAPCQHSLAAFPRFFDNHYPAGGFLIENMSMGNKSRFAEPRSLADPEVAARKLMEIANGVEVIQDGRIYIECINAPFLNECGGSVDEYKAGLQLAITKGWLVLHESGSFVRFTQAGSELFA